MAQKLYKVVVTNWTHDGRTCKDIGCKYKPEKAAKDEMKALSQKDPTRLYSIELKK